MTFAELKTKVAEFANRSDLTSIIAVLVPEVQREIETAADFRFMQFSTEQASSSHLITIPEYKTGTTADSLKRIEWVGIVDSTGKHKELKRRSFKYAMEKWPSFTGDIGEPEIYVPMWVTEQYLIRPTPSQSYTFKTLGLKFTTPLSGDADKNWWTLNAPLVLIYGTLVALEPYLKNDERMVIWKAQFVEKLSAIKRAHKPDYAGGPISSAHDSVP